MILMGIDPGEKRIGVAVGETETALPEGVATIVSRDPAEALRRLEDLVRRHRPDRLVVGLPLNMDGTRGPAARRAQRFARTLGEATGLPVDLVDERATSAEARERLRSTGRGNRSRREREDQTAAALLLEAYLDARRGGGPS